MNFVKPQKPQPMTESIKEENLQPKTNKQTDGLHPDISTIKQPVSDCDLIKQIDPKYINNKIRTFNFRTYSYRIFAEQYLLDWKS